jgi:hypothetical protein
MNLNREERKEKRKKDGVVQTKEVLAMNPK